MQDNDHAWKEILTYQLKEFTEFFWPEAYKNIDWYKPYESLEQEMRQIQLDDEIGKRHVDKLFQVFLKNGKEQWLLLHIEVMHSEKADFEQRMFYYYYRVFDKYNRDIASLAVLCDKNKRWRPDRFHRETLGSSLTRAFKVIKIVDFQGQEEMLLASSNLFAKVILVQLAALKTQKKEAARLASKFDLLRLLLAQRRQYNWSYDQIKNLLLFLDNMLLLPKEFEIKYVEQAEQLEEKYDMNLTFSAERVGFDKGMQQGRQEGMQQGIQSGKAHLLTKMLEAKFKDIPEACLQRINSADTSKLNAWAVNFVYAQNIDDVFKE